MEVPDQLGTQLLGALDSRTEERRDETDDGAQQEHPREEPPAALVAAAKLGDQPPRRLYGGCGFGTLLSDLNHAGILSRGGRPSRTRLAEGRGIGESRG